MFKIFILLPNFSDMDKVKDGEEGISVHIIIIIIDNRGLNARWCLTPLLLSLPTAAYLGQRGLTPAGLPHTTAQCHLTILSEAVLFCLNHPKEDGLTENGQMTLSSGVGQPCRS